LSVGEPGETNQANTNNQEQNGDIPLAFQVFRPNFVTFAPPVHYARDEVVFMVPLEPSFHSVILDPLEQKEEETEARQLMNLAIRETLSIEKRESLINEIKKGRKVVIVNQLGITPEKLALLVENNPNIALEVLIKLVDSPDITEYFAVLVNMEMSVHVLEVVNRLTLTVDLPKEFLHLFISNCISTCEGFQDKYLQSRLVRLSCVFLQSLIRNRSIDIEELYIEIMTFCVEFSRIREAAALYRLMKQLESEDCALQQALTKKLEGCPVAQQQLSEAALARSFGSKI